MSKWCFVNCLWEYIGDQLSWSSLWQLAGIMASGALLGCGALAKAGGILGTVIGPEGTIAGALGGGLVGAVLGALAAAAIAITADILIGILACLFMCRNA